MPRCIECGQLTEYCVCTADSLFEDEEASNYINIGQDYPVALYKPKATKKPGTDNE